jgi:hypothetical protein
MVRQSYLFLVGLADFGVPLLNGGGAYLAPLTWHDGVD